jgi:hypothetical protein
MKGDRAVRELAGILGVAAIMVGIAGLTTLIITSMINYQLALS